MKVLNPQKHKKLLLVAAGALLLVVIILISVWPRESEEEDILWREYPVKTGSITASLDSGGLLEATGVRHSADVELKLDQIFVDAGQEVKAGDTLATYSKEALQEKVNELSDLLGTAQRVLEDAQNDKRRAQLESQLSQTQDQQGQETSYESSKREIDNAIQTGERTVLQLQVKIQSLQEALWLVEQSDDGTVSSSSLQSLKDQLTRFQKDLERLQANSRAVASDQQISALVQQRRGYYDQLDDIDRQIRDISNANSRLQQLKRDLAHVQQQIVDVKAQIAAYTPPSVPDPPAEPNPSEGLEPQEDNDEDGAPNVDDTTLETLKAQLEALTAQETSLQNEIKDYPDQSDQLRQLQTQRRSIERSISGINDQIEAQEDTAAIEADIQKKQSQINDVQEQIKALSAKEEKILTLQEQMVKAQEDLENANFDLETQRIALQNLDGDYNIQIAQAESYEATRAQIDALTNAKMDNAIENAQAEIKKINAELAAARKLLNTPALTAKIDGVVTLVSYTPGDTVPAGKSVVTIGSDGEKCVVTEVPQEDIGSVEIDQVVEMQFVANPDVTLLGKVIEKNLVPTEGSDGVTYTVRIAFDEAQPDLLQGMTCSVKFILKRVENVLTLANKAITLNDGKQTVLVQLPDGTREERIIKTGFSDGRTSEVIDGLADGDIVVVAG